MFLLSSPNWWVTDKSHAWWEKCVNKQSNLIKRWVIFCRAVAFQMCVMDQALDCSLVVISFSWLCLRNKAFPNSYVLIIIAHAGATFISRGIKPANSPDMPFSATIRFITLYVLDETCVDNFIACISPSSTCRLVFTTSNGKVMIAAIDPDTAPAVNVMAKVGFEL